MSHVIDARAAFAEKRARAANDDAFALFTGLAYALPVSAAMWALILGSLFWAF